ncbi:hypothetical protein ABK040_013858 [Willaertia magna]
MLSQEETLFLNPSSENTSSKRSKSDNEDVTENDESNESDRKFSVRKTRKQVNYNEDRDEHNIGDVEEEVKSKKQKKHDEEEDESYKITYEEERGVLTCLKIKKLPKLLNKLLESLDQNCSYDVYAIQTLFLNCAMDIQNFKNEDMVFEFVKETVMSNEEFKINMKEWNDPTPKSSYDEENDKKMIENYNELMESEEQAKLRHSYQSQLKEKEWSKADWEKFHEAFAIYGDGHDSNKKIAQYMGEHIHANQVAYHKGQWKKKKN